MQVIYPCCYLFYSIYLSIYLRQSKERKSLEKAIICIYRSKSLITYPTSRALSNKYSEIETKQQQQQKRRRNVKDYAFCCYCCC